MQQNRNKYMAAWRLANRTKLNEYKARYRSTHHAQIKRSAAKYYLNHAAIIKSKVAKYGKDNPKKVRISYTRWARHNRDRLRQYKRNWMAQKLSTPTGRINQNMRRALLRVLGSKKANRHWQDLVGYTVAALLGNFETKYYNGMTKESFGKNEVHIHHIKPQHTFKYKTAEDPEFKACWALSNLQPLWRKDHIELHRGKKTLKEILAGEGI